MTGTGFDSAPAESPMQDPGWPGFFLQLDCMRNAGSGRERRLMDLRAASRRSLLRPARLRAAGAVRLLLLGILAAGCGKSPEPVPPVPSGPPPAVWAQEVAQGPWNVLLLTLDTTRQDVVSCYGETEGLTPNIDSLAAAGIRFEQAVTPVPTTCPAHATILTGLDPHEHGVRYNGRYIAGDSLLCLAELFREAGYQTAAFVAAFPLDGRFGLTQGFQIYDDTFLERVVSHSEETAQRRADAVTDAVLGWAAERKPGPFFLWVHYFDPHIPWDPPEPFASRHPGDPYRGEVAFMDHEVGRLMRGLDRLGMCDSTFVIAVGDHGESLGEHGEETHSFFIYDATLRVPLTLTPPPRWRGPPDLGAGVYRPQVRLRDLAPTIANLMGWPADHWEAVGSTSLLPLVDSGAQAPVAAGYIETLVPLLDYGWSDLRGVRTGDWKYIRAPQPELYRFRTDPAETVNVIADYPDVTSRLEAWLDWYLAAEAHDASQTAALDAETIERLRSLGYLQGAVEPQEGSGADPKDRLEAYQAIHAARSATANHRPREAIRLLESVVRQEPHNTELLRLLASAFAQDEQYERAMTLFDRVLKRQPTDTRTLKEAIQVAALQGDEEKAFQMLDVLRSAAPDEAGAELLAGRIHEQAGRLDDALRAYRAELRRHPDSYEASYRIGRILREQGRTGAACDALEDAAAIMPAYAPCLAELAELAYEADDVARGDSLVAAALAADPYDPQANFRRGWRANQEGDAAAAREAYERAVRASPEFAAAHTNLANVYLNAGQAETALEHYEIALELGHETALLRTNQGVALAQLGRMQEAGAAWERALQLDPEPGLAEGIRSNLQRLRRQIGGM
ncbi:MAG: sulfatase-like hydrolase/transferase [Candidatus Eisenbacteria bacterium]|nr:sulfatase-like hydrolase/transferase [Candidatus Eisenbacteria bacterium]